MLFNVASLPPLYCFPHNSCYFSILLNSINYTHCLYFCLNLLGYKLYMGRELCAYKVVLTLKINIFYVIDIKNKENHMIICDCLLPVFLFHHRSLSDSSPTPVTYALTMSHRSVIFCCYFYLSFPTPFFKNPNLRICLLIFRERERWGERERERCM